MASEMERIWLAEYLKCFNATEAARRAGYAHPNAQGPAKKKKFAEEIDAALQEKIMSADEALSKISEAAKFDPSPYIDKQGRLVGVDLDQLIEDGYGHLIRKLTPTKYGTKIEWADPDWAAEVVLKHHTKGPSGAEDDPLHVQHSISVGNVDLDDDV